MGTRRSPMDFEEHFRDVMREAVEKAVAVIERRMGRPQFVKALRSAIEKQPEGYAVTTRAVGPGSRGRCILECLARAGGSLPAVQIARSISAGGAPPRVHLRRVREQLHYLALPANRFVKSVRPGVWVLTSRGRRVIEAGKAARASAVAVEAEEMRA